MAGPAGPGATALWNHLKKVELADPEFGTPVKIDLVLGTDVYDKVIRHG